MTTYFSYSVNHREVSQPHGPEQVEHLGDVGVGRHCVRTWVHVGGDILGAQGTFFFSLTRFSSVLKYQIEFLFSFPMKLWTGRTTIMRGLSRARSRSWISGYRG